MLNDLRCANQISKAWCHQYAQMFDQAVRHLNSQSLSASGIVRQARLSVTKITEILSRPFGDIRSVLLPRYSS